MKKIKLIIFDMDGLLIDSERVYRDGWLYSIKKHEVNLDKEIINSWVGKGISQTSKAIVDSLGDERWVKILRDSREEYIIKELDSGRLIAKPYALLALDYAKKNDYKIALASSSYSKRSLVMLEKLNLKNYFNFMVFGDQVENLKPEPDLYLRVLEKLQLRASNALVVEDSITGAIAAQKAGINVFLIPDDNFNHVHNSIPENIVSKGRNLLNLVDYLKK